MLVIGGCEKFTGAPALAAMAALASLRSGTDLCTVAAPQKAAWVISTYSPDLIAEKLPGKGFSERHLRRLLELQKNADATLIGPGMGREKKPMALARQFAAKSKGAMVVDADALFACAGMKFKMPAIITPHAHEFLEFTAIKIEGKKLGEKIKIVEKSARKHNCTILLKGRVDIISDGAATFINSTGNAGMSVGGTGDVLAGLCAGFSALGATPVNAAAAAAFVNGKIGDGLFKKMGYSFIASDFIGQIPKWIKKILQ